MLIKRKCRCSVIPPHFSWASVTQLEKFGENDYYNKGYRQPT